MKKLLVVGCSLVLGFVVLSGFQIEKGPTGLIVKPGQALRPTWRSRPPPARAGRQGEGPNHRQRQGESPGRDQRLILSAQSPT